MRTGELAFLLVLTAFVGFIGGAAFGVTQSDLWKGEVVTMRSFVEHREVEYFPSRTTCERWEKDRIWRIAHEMVRDPLSVSNCTQIKKEDR